MKTCAAPAVVPAAPVSAVTAATGAGAARPKAGGFRVPAATGARGVPAAHRRASALRAFAARGGVLARPVQGRPRPPGRRPRAGR